MLFSFVKAESLVFSFREIKMGNRIGYRLQNSRKRSVESQHEDLAELDNTRESFRNLDQLPVEVIIKIFSYLSFEDMLSLRKVSKGFYDASKCPIFCDKIKFKIIKLSKETFEKLEHMLKLRQSKITLDIRDLPVAEIKFFMPYFSDVVDISITLRHLKHVSMHCNNLYRLTVKLNVSVKQNYKDVFSCIGKLSNLNKLILEANYQPENVGFTETKHNRQKALALKMCSISALKYSQGVVTEIEFRYVPFIFKHQDCDEEFRRSFMFANHIKSWSFTGYNISGNLIPLPKSIRKLEIIRGSMTKFDLDHTDVNTLILKETNFDIDRRGRRDYPDIKTLELHKIFLNLFETREIHFPNLHNLTIVAPVLTKRLLFSDPDERDFLRGFIPSLKQLTLISVKGVDFRELGLILDCFLSLTDLCFINVSGIPSEFLNVWENRLNVVVIRR